MYCTRCGMELPDSARACRSCGHPAGAAVTSGVGVAPAARYAGFLRRVAAALLDGVIYTVLLIPVIIVLGVLAAPSFTAGSEPPPAIVIFYYAMSWGLGWLYYAIQHASHHQATFGKRALGVKVVTLDGRRLTFAHASGRYLAYLLASFTLGIGFAMAAFTKRRQALHDKMAGTLVVSRETAPGDVESGLAMPKTSGAVVAVAIAASLAPLAGVVAAIAIPAYADYVGRAQVVTGLESAAPIQSRVEQAHAAGTPLEEIDSETLGLDVEASDSPYVRTLEVVSGAIVITYGGEASASVADGQLVLVPGSSPSGEVVWVCGLAEIPDGVTPSVRAHAQYTTFEPSQLPARCR